MGALVSRELRIAPEMIGRYKRRSLCEEELPPPFWPAELLQVIDYGRSHLFHLSLHAMHGSELMNVAVMSAAESIPFSM